MKSLRQIVALVLLAASPSMAQFAQPFEWNWSMAEDRLEVSVEIPANAYLYAERTAVEVPGAGAPLMQPEGHAHTDEFGTADVYEGGQVHRWVYSVAPGTSYTINVRYQGCGSSDGRGAICYAPGSEQFMTGEPGELAPVAGVLAAANSSALEKLLESFEVVRTDGGMKNPEEMLAFLELNQSESVSSGGLLDGKNGLLVVLLVLVGGLALNLTPCVLPMIPVNLAIIGAGSAAASKQQGFLRGGVYGSGIALAYGALGMFAVLTGSKFGSLNASPVFNFVMGLVFIVLALAMFDVLNIDLARFGSKSGGSEKKQGGLIPAFMMGVVAALLAGACVAPIVIAVLLQATTMYAAGNPVGLFLPLLLGIGMALPWPIAGAGLAILPKPGMWMVKIKHGFGILVALLGVYYGYLGYELLAGHGEGSSTEEALADLEVKLQQALDEDKPVFIDFWATWCKNCLAMNATTFKDEQVIERLHDFQEIRFQAEDPNDPAIKRLMDRYSLPGLPGYALLTPKK